MNILICHEKNFKYNIKYVKKIKEYSKIKKRLGNEKKRMC